MTSPLSISAQRQSLSDKVFETLQDRILQPELAPGAKLSEVEIAKSFDISRQPVRDAFYRLSQLGFLEIRPQRATTVSLISPQAILEARFFRTACEVEIVQRAAMAMTQSDATKLADLLAQQEAAVTTTASDTFKRLDDAFHRELCRISGLETVWARIAENKAHTDRLRLLSIRDSSEQALQDHRDILAALEARDGQLAAQRMRQHLDRIREVLHDLRMKNSDWFIPGRNE